MRTFARTVDLMHNDRLFSVYPQIVGTIMEELYRSDGNPRKSIAASSWKAVKETVRIKDLISDVVKGGASLL